MKKLDFTKLESLRKEKGFTQKKISELLFMTQSNYCKLERSKKKMDSLQLINRLAGVLEMPRDRLIGILSNQENIQSSGMKSSELMRIEEILKDKPLREDEFILFSTEVLELEKHGFKNKYSGLNLNNIGDDDIFPMDDYPPLMNIICADTVEISFDYQKKTLKGISVWLAGKKLGIISEHYAALVEQLIMQLLISRVVLIENEDSIPGYFDTYMKVAFIATNAICKSAEFKKGRFSIINFLTQEEIENIENTDN